MKDLNFFSIYQGNSKEQKDEKIYFYIAAGLLLAIILISVTFNVAKILILNKNINDYTEKLNASNVQTQLKEAEEINDKLAILGEYDTDISSVANSVKKEDMVTDDLLNDICGAMPKDISFKEFKIDQYEVNISGIAHTRQAVGEYEHNLSQLSKIKSVHVNNIAKSNAVGEDYSFEMTCVLREVQ